MHLHEISPTTVGAIVIVMLTAFWLAFSPFARALGGTFVPGLEDDSPTPVKPATTRSITAPQTSPTKSARPADLQPTPKLMPAQKSSATDAPTPVRPAPKQSQFETPPPPPKPTRSEIPPSKSPAIPPPQAPPAQASLPKSPPAPKPVPPECSGRTKDVRLMVDDVLKTNVFNITWFEDKPKKDYGHGMFRIFDDHGDVQIEMIGSDGSSVGTSPAKICVVTRDGQKHLRVGLQTARLSFGLAWLPMRSMLIKSTGRTDELPLRVSAGPRPGLIHIEDAFDNGEQIGSSFSPRTAK